MNFYPLKFVPIYKNRIWGGRMMQDNLKRSVPKDLLPVGESWELVDRPEDVSTVANGVWAGRKLNELLNEFHSEILGPKGNGSKRFPLLIKLIDAGERLSLQVHPEEHICRELQDGSEPKTEMWYVLGCESGGKILAGLSPKATRLHLQELLNSPKVEEMLQIYESKVGDGYFITSGTLHAIGGGNLILEIQQNSDTTYRISDWGRVDAAGNSRELHVEKGLKSINFMNRISPKITGISGQTAFNRRIPMVNQCPFFNIEELHLVSEWSDTTSTHNSFQLLSAVNRPFQVGNGENTTEVLPGETVLIPYAMGSYKISSDFGSGECIIVKTTL